MNAQSRSARRSDGRGWLLALPTYLRFVLELAASGEVPPREEELALARELGQVSVFSRVIIGWPDWENALLASEVFVQEAEDVVAASRAETGAPKRYDAVVRKVAASHTG